MKFPFLLSLISAQDCYTDLQLIQMSEGFRACMYYDTRGIPTICYGFNLNKSSASSDLANVGADYSSVMNGGCLTESQCTQLLQQDVLVAENAE